MDNIAPLTQQLEYQFLKTIIHGLRNKTITVEEAKKFATEFLAVEPFANEEDAGAKVDEFFANHPEFLKLKEYMDNYEKELETEGKVNTMSKLIKENNIDEALNVAKE